LKAELKRSLIARYETSGPLAKLLKLRCAAKRIRFVLFREAKFQLPSTPSAYLSLKFTIYHSTQLQVPRAAGLSAFGRSLTFFTPGRAMLHDPIEQRSLKPNIVPNLFALNPLMAKDLFSFRQKLLV
jgi:hypothetical protein